MTALKAAKKEAVKEESDAESEGSAQVPEAKDLVNFKVDMNRLAEYMENIIRVVNQHAKLIDKVAEELEVRPKGIEVGEMFSCLSLAFPYEESLKQMGLSVHPPREKKVIEMLDSHGVAFNLSLASQLAVPVDNSWEGLDRLLKIIELLGRASTHLKDMQLQAEAHINKAHDELALKLPRTEFEGKFAQLKSKTKTKLKSNFDALSALVEQLKQFAEESLLNMDTKLKEIETNTYWKIADYEKLLAQRPTRIFVEEYVTEAVKKMTSGFSSTVKLEFGKLSQEARLFEMVGKHKMDNDRDFEKVKIRLEKLEGGGEESPSVAADSTL